MSERQGFNQTGQRGGRRRELVGLVTSAKMEKSVVVVVDRLVRHPVYKRVIRRRSKFMAHDELGCHAGDKVRIVEARPLSARKRWRVVEVIQPAVIPSESPESEGAEFDGSEEREDGD